MQHFSSVTSQLSDILLGKERLSMSISKTSWHCATLEFIKRLILSEKDFISILCEVSEKTGKRRYL